METGSARSHHEPTEVSNRAELFRNFNNFIQITLENLWLYLCQCSLSVFPQAFRTCRPAEAVAPKSYRDSETWTASQVAGQTLPRLQTSSGMLLLQLGSRLPVTWHHLLQRG